MDEFFTHKFVKIMYTNMWQFINKDTIESMFSKELSRAKIRFSRKRDVNDDNFSVSQKNTICFKGDVNAGHWVYVDKLGIPHSTYEEKIIYDNDDGVCHGAAMIYALGYDTNYFPLISNPQTIAQYKKNYKSLIEFYIYLIQSGKWDYALRSHFGMDVDWVNNTTNQTIKSLKTLNDFLRTI